MITIRKSEARGHFNFGWLETYHTFSFDQYFDPAHSHFHSLRVINEDRVRAGQGFPTHSHRDMEIITYILSGSLEHRDSMGNGSVIRPGDVQRMSAGTGVSHSEFNPSPSEACHLLQIWITPKLKKLTPSYEQKFFGEYERRGQLCLIAADDGGGGAVTIHQDARVYAGLFDGSESATLNVKPGRRVYAHVARGAVTANGTVLNTGDALKLTDAEELVLKQGNQAEVLVFDLPGSKS